MAQQPMRAQSQELFEKAVASYQAKQRLLKEWIEFQRHGKLTYSSFSLQDAETFLTEYVSCSSTAETFSRDNGNVLLDQGDFEINNSVLSSIDQQCDDYGAEAAEAALHTKSFKFTNKFIVANKHKETTTDVDRVDEIACLITKSSCVYTEGGFEVSKEHRSA